MAEAFLRERLRRDGVDATVHSAGLLQSGRPATDHGVSVLADLGLDIRAHRSRTIDERLLGGADLVLGMAREHVREAVVLVPEIWPRAFTLKELVRRAIDVGPRTPGQPLDEWLAKCHAGRSHAELLGDSHEDDVADPIGMAKGAYARTAGLVLELVDRLAELAFPTDGDDRSEPHDEGTA